MSKKTPRVDRRAYLEATGVAVAAGVTGLAGCLGESDGSATGTLATRVKDQPGDIEDFQSCVVTIEGLWLKPDEAADDGGTEDDNEMEDEDEQRDDGGVEAQDEEDIDESERREYHGFDEPREADLVELQDGNTQLVEQREVGAGTHQFLQLDVSAADGVLNGGGDASVRTPGNAPLQFKEPFEIREGRRTTFVADFTPVKRGQTDRYLLQPVARGVRVESEDDTTSDRHDGEADATNSTDDGSEGEADATNSTGGREMTPRAVSREVGG